MNGLSIVFLVPLGACEHWITVTAEITVSASATVDLTEEAPSRVVALLQVPKTSAHLYSLGVLCEPATEDVVVTLVHDSFGCAKSGTLEAWLEPIAVDTGISADCGIERALYGEGAAQPPDGAPYASVAVFAAETSTNGCTNGEEAVELVLE